MPDSQDRFGISHPRILALQLPTLMVKQLRHRSIAAHKQHRVIWNLSRLEWYIFSQGQRWGISIEVMYN
jgi:DNA-binding HxlR family transcriptional regulator